MIPTCEEPKNSFRRERNEKGWVSSHPRLRKGKVKMELYVNKNWTEHYNSVYLAEAIIWSENGNHATIYATGSTAHEADTRLMNALRELSVLPKATVRGNACSLTGSQSPDNASSGGDEVETDKR